MKTVVRRWILAALLAGLAGCAPATPLPVTRVPVTHVPVTGVPAPRSPATYGTTPLADCVGRPIVIGEISDDPSEVIQGVQPLADYLAGQLAPYGIACGVVTVARDVDEMIALIRNGEVDVYWDSVYPVALVRDATGAQPILRRQRHCVETYHAVMFARADSGITSLEDLRGRTIAMDNRFSTTGFVLPSAYLLQRGLALAVVPDYATPPAGDRTDIFFANDDENVIELVVGGQVPAGVADDYHYASMAPDTRDDMVVLAETEPVLRQVVLVRADLPGELREALKAELLQAGREPAAQAALATAEGTCRFDEQPAAIEATLVRMRAFDALIQTIPGLRGPELPPP